MEVPCNYCIVKYWDLKAHYKCSIENIKIVEQKDWKLQGKHMSGKTNNDVTIVSFVGRSISIVPQGFNRIFPNLQALEIRDSSLKTLTKDDFKDYKNLKFVVFEDNSIDFLPGNLFKGFKNLEFILFTSCNLKLIEPSIVNGLVSLKRVSFVDRQNYDLHFSTLRRTLVNGMLEETKNELYKRYFTSDLRLQFANQSTCHHTLSDDFKKFLKNEKFKDLKIQIGDREFFAHKFLLAMRSPILAEMIHDIPDAANLNLVDIPVETFEQVLFFIYNDELPAEIKGINFLHLFAAAGRLKIELLKSIAAANLFDQINKENAISFLNLSNRYAHDMLKRKVFNEIKKMYSNIIFKDEWANQVELVIKVIEIHEEKEKAMKKFEEEYQKLMKETGGDKIYKDGV